MEQKEGTPTNARYHLLTISASCLSRPQHILSSNSERALVIATLQDNLSARAAYDSNLRLNPKLLASHIDLLGFSITRDHISLLVFTISKESLLRLGKNIITALTDFQNHESTYRPRSVRLRMSNQELQGPHMALEVSLQLHTHHSDWEYDRYSSVGFYLHGRRGDWMRLWRMARLYKDSPENYRNLLVSSLQHQRALLQAR